MSILDDQRSVVSAIPGTTRDAIDTLCEWKGQPFVLCDTAGIRHRSKRSESVEVFSVMRSEEAIRRADLCVLVIDATEGVTAQDKKHRRANSRIPESLPDRVEQMGRHCCITVRARSELLRQHVARVREKLFFHGLCTCRCPVSENGNQRDEALHDDRKIRQHATRRTGTGELNRYLRATMERQPPPMRGKRRLKLLYATQLVPPEAETVSGSGISAFRQRSSTFAEKLHKLSARAACERNGNTPACRSF